MELLLKMLADHGHTPEALEEMRDTAPTNREAISRQGEAVLLFLEAPAKFTAKLCKRCGEAFGTNYRAVAYCTDQCRSKAVSEQLGVKWDWLRATEEERWGGEPPLIIPPAALQKIQQFVTWFADNLPTAKEIESQIPTSPEVPQEQLELEAAEQQEVQLETATRTNPHQSLPELLPEHKTEEESPFDFW